MFTGLIREVANVASYHNNILTISAKYKPKIGDSIAINGACLTVIKVDDQTFSVELSNESRALLAMDNYKANVHIEPAMSLGDRLDGHMVQGHIDCIGTIKEIKQNENAVDIIIGIDQEYMKYVIPKGSISVDGVSLTTNEVYDSSFRLTIIPHTFKETIFSSYKVGTKVNIETDLFARYIYNMFKPSKETKISWSDIDSIISRY